MIGGKCWLEDRAQEVSFWWLKPGGDAGGAAGGRAGEVILLAATSLVFTLN